MSGGLVGVERPWGVQRWRDLLFLHWAVAPDPLRPRIPDPLVLDLHAGRAYVGLVAFRMEGVRPGWLPARFGFAFPETNVRTYVRGPDGTPGVYFFSLDAGSWLAVAAARAGFGLPYYAARMRVDAAPSRVAYCSERIAPGRPGLRAEAALGPVRGSAPQGTLEEFLVERYLLYGRRRGALWRGRVHHAPYPLREAALGPWDETLLRAAGLQRPPEPPLVHFATGVDVVVGRPCPCPPDGLRPG
jgi:uncharacterized protein